MYIDIHISTGSRVFICLAVGSKLPQSATNPPQKGPSGSKTLYVNNIYHTYSLALSGERGEGREGRSQACNHECMIRTEVNQQVLSELWFSVIDIWTDIKIWFVLVFGCLPRTDPRGPDTRLTGDPKQVFGSTKLRLNTKTKRQVLLTHQVRFLLNRKDHEKAPDTIRNELSVCLRVCH